jgi:hypothetical protein
VVPSVGMRDGRANELRSTPCVIRDSVTPLRKNRAGVRNLLYIRFARSG